MPLPRGALQAAVELAAGLQRWEEYRDGTLECGCCHWVQRPYLGEEHDDPECRLGQFLRDAGRLSEEDHKRAHGE